MKWFKSLSVGGGKVEAVNENCFGRGLLLQNKLRICVLLKWPLTVQTLEGIPSKIHGIASMQLK